VFPALRVAVFCDGCYWHGCPEHGAAPVANAAWWRKKFDATRRRDAETSAILLAAGWVVIRVWEHEDAEVTADNVYKLVQERRHEVDGQLASRELRNHGKEELGGEQRRG
jgi:DNA mismatch endonuclease, patch repair protein